MKLKEEKMYRSVEKNIQFLMSNLFTITHKRKTLFKVRV